MLRPHAFRFGLAALVVVLCCADIVEAQLLRGRRAGATVLTSNVQPVDLQGAVQDSVFQKLVAEETVVQKSPIQDWVVQKSAVQVVYAQPCSVRYIQHCPFRKYGCGAPVEAILMVSNPCSGCAVNVPVCLPACCVDAPAVSARPALFGRQIVAYEWCCGYSIRFVFDRFGDLTVHYYGT